MVREAGLEAAAAGQGIALGWCGFIERYLDTGALVTLGDGFFEPRNHFCGVLTDQGRRNPVAQTCLAFLARSATGGAADTPPPSQD